MSPASNELPGFFICHTIYIFAEKDKATMSKYLSILFLCCLPTWLWAGENYRFRVYLKDKGDSGFTVEEPEAFLSKESIQRRKKAGTPVTASDLPIAHAYLDTLVATGAEPVVQSKWLSTVVVTSKDSTVADRLKNLTMVDSVKWVWKGHDVTPAQEDDQEIRLSPSDAPLKEKYGYAERQIKMLNGIKLHDAGFRGEGMRVAVIDAGFQNVDRICVFDSLQLIGTHNVIYPGRSVYEADDHGTKVLSCMAANKPNVLVGTAPEASYWLLRSEDDDTEQPVEEDYWAEALEFADSVGVDVVNTSLGYYEFDDTTMNYRYRDLDGHYSLMSHSASLAADKGLVLVCSAGNSGRGTWKKITPPGDAENVITVGAADRNLVNADFSSVGNTTDGRVKPDVMAVGVASAVAGNDGTVSHANGTSFASPTLCGLVACFWQACPWLTAKQVVEAVRNAGDRKEYPDNIYGYGVPDIWKACQIELEKKK